MTNLLNLIERAFSYGQGKKKDGHWPSEITACPRMLVYRWMGMGESNPIDSTGWWRIHLGNAIHSLCQETLQHIEQDPEMLKDLGWEGYHIETEVRSGKIPIEGLKFPISFRMDNRFVDNDGQLAIAEYKTSFGFGMKAIKEEGPKDAALAQTIVYLVLSPKLEKPVTRGYIMYVSRDNADRVLFILDRVEKGFILSRMFESGELNEMRKIPASTWDKMIDKLKFIEDCVEKKALPDRPYLVAIKNGEIRETFTKDKVPYKSDWHCMYCSYLTKCWGERAASLPEGDNSAEFKKGQGDTELEGF
jgi:CRISPR/Cas system-associated exonuclease Cas4 (RecB family)